MLFRSVSSAASDACLFNEDPDVALPRQVRKAIGKSFAHVAEVYSVPRITPLCPKYGLKSGSAMDLRTGFDFSKTSHQKRAWAILEQESPFLIVLSPPCTVWSTLRNLSNFKRDPGPWKFPKRRDRLWNTWSSPLRLRAGNMSEVVFSSSSSQLRRAVGGNPVWSPWPISKGFCWLRPTCASSDSG